MSDYISTANDDIDPPYQVYDRYVPHDPRKLGIRWLVEPNLHFKYWFVQSLEYQEGYDGSKTRQVNKDKCEEMDNRIQFVIEQLGCLTKYHTKSGLWYILEDHRTSYILALNRELLIFSKLIQDAKKMWCGCKSI